MTEVQWSGSSTPYLGGNRADAWGEEAADRGRVGGQRILKAGPRPADDDVARRLNLHAGAAVIERQRLILLDGEPVELANSYWPATWASETPLAQPSKIPGGAVSLLSHLGYTPTSVDEEVATRPPTDGEFGQLRLTAGEWVLTLIRTIRTHNDHPYEVSVMVSPGHLGRLHYSMKVD